MNNDQINLIDRTFLLMISFDYYTWTSQHNTINYLKLTLRADSLKPATTDSVFLHVYVQFPSKNDVLNGGAMLAQYQLNVLCLVRYNGRTLSDISNQQKPSFYVFVWISCPSTMHIVVRWQTCNQNLVSTLHPYFYWRVFLKLSGNTLRKDRLHYDRYKNLHEMLE